MNIRQVERVNISSNILQILKCSLCYVVLNQYQFIQMSHIKVSEEDKLQPVNDPLDQLSPHHHLSKTNKGKKQSSCFKYLHIIYWIIFIILIWNLIKFHFYQETQSEWLESAKIKQQLRLRQIDDLERDIDLSKETNKQKEALLKSNIKGSLTKINYISEMTMEQHYLNKINTFRQLSKNQNFLKENDKARVSFLLAMNSFKLIHQNIHIKRQIGQLLKTQYERLSKIHDFTLPQKPFCIVVPTLNNGKDFRYLYNLRSIFNQNYTNYKVVIIDDASTDQNFELISQYISDNPVPQKVFLLKNRDRMTAIPNIYKAATDYCQIDDILALVDGDDELLGVNVLKVFNSMYTLKGLEVLYSNIIVNDKNSYVKMGWSSAYSEEEKRLNKYREGDTRMFPLRSFKVRTFLKIRVSDLKDRGGKWFTSAYDQTICPQVLELSCGKNEYIDQFFYLYNYGLGNNDIEINANLNYGIMNEIRFNRKRYTCPN